MTFIACENGVIFRVPSAWTAWRIGDVAYTRTSDSSIVACIGGTWHRVESWQSVVETERRRSFAGTEALVEESRE